jgi:hypothetical protein
VYFNESSSNGETTSDGFELANAQGLWTFELSQPHAGGDEPELPDPKPSVASGVAGSADDGAGQALSRVTAEQIAGTAPATLPPSPKARAAKSPKATKARKR